MRKPGAKRLDYDALRNYTKSIPKTAKSISMRPVMRDGKPVATEVVYIDGVTPVSKTFPLRSQKK